MIIQIKSKSITYSKDNKYYGTNYWFHNDNDTLLLNNKENNIKLFMVPNKNDWIEIPSNIYTIKIGSSGFSNNIPIEIILPNNYKELIRAIPTAHIAEYLLLDIACIAGGFLEDKISSEDAIEFYELYKDI